MENKLLEEKAAIEVMVRRFNLINLFVPFFLLFSAIAVLVAVYIINTESLANVYELYSYLFVAAGMALLLKAFVSVYANSLYAIAKKKWVLLAINLVVFPIQVFLGVSAAYVLTENTYILYPLQFLTVAAGLFYVQNLIDNNFKILDLSLVGLGLYLSVFLITYFRLLDGDIRFWNASGVVVLLVEVFLFFVANRKFLKVIG
jgi:hypothetical protein